MGSWFTPPHNPPHDGGSNPIPRTADRRESDVTKLDRGEGKPVSRGMTLLGLKRVTLEKALHASTTHRHDYLNAYVGDLATRGRHGCYSGAKIAMGGIRSGVRVHYWGPIAERYGLNLTVVNEAVDPTFAS